VHINIQIEDVGENLWSTIAPFAPFGMGNPKPVFYIKNAEIKSAKNFGKKNDHLEIVFKTKEGKSVKAIQFFTTIEDQKISLTVGSKISLTAHLEKSFFLNRPEVRLRLIEIGL
jgi:single-stranded-DNA-specific exonuclease